MGDAVQYVEKVDYNDTQVPLPNGEGQVLDGEIGIRIRDAAHKAYPDVQEKRAVEHLKDGVKHYGDAMIHLANAVGEGIVKPLAVNLELSPETKAMPKKIGKKIKNWAKGIFPT
jgi:hypothetical protein